MQHKQTLDHLHTQDALRKPSDSHHTLSDDSSYGVHDFSVVPDLESIPRVDVEMATEALPHLLARDQSSFKLGSITSLAPPKPVPDDTSKFLITDEQNKPCFVMTASWCGIENNLVSLGVNAIAKVSKILEDDVAPAVLQPVSSKTISNFVYALWPYATPLREKQPFRTWDRIKLRRWGAWWLEALTRQTLRLMPECDQDEYLTQPLNRIVEDTGFDSRLRDLARQAIQEANDQRWRPYYVLMHNDLWMGNWLHAPKSLRRKTKFVIIDWPGMLADGYPIFDIARFSESMNIRPRAFHRTISAHANMLSCSVAQTRYHLLVAAGYIGLHLNHFKEENYRHTVNICMAKLDQAIDE
ncbi:phosphotransferase [Poriferisphaera sp. WC338]|uniref:phosphotransferase n=1 Tax=Poriferisphaera sp. WC338 TaxID=3425129 RepID=UPI003D815D03